MTGDRLLSIISGNTSTKCIHSIWTKVWSEPQICLDHTVFITSLTWPEQYWLGSKTTNCTKTIIILQDPAYNTGKFGEIRELILGMLETYNYEQTLMITCKNLMNHDLHVHLRSLTRAAVKGYVPKSDQCSICAKRYLNQRETDSIIVFRLVGLSVCPGLIIYSYT